MNGIPWDRGPLAKVFLKRYSWDMKVVIVGGGRLGVHIAKELIAEKHDVVLIDRDADAAKSASNELDCLVIHDDGSQPEVLKKAGAGKATWLLALTGSDEVNIVSCSLVAVEFPQIRTVARVDNPFYSQLNKIQRKVLGMDVLINPSIETAETVARIVDEGFAEDVIPLHSGQLQLRHLAVEEIPRFVNHSLQEIRSQAHCDFLIVAVVRGRNLEIPTGENRLLPGDWIYVLGTPEALDELLGQIAGIRQPIRKIFILGATKVSEGLIKNLLSKEKDRGEGSRSRSGTQRQRRITFIDSNREVCKALARKYQNVEVLCADATDEGLLEEVGLPMADLVVCATESQTFNILTAQLAKSLGARKSLAITLNDRYQILGSTLEVDALISIKNVVAANILQLLRRAQIRTIHDFFEDDVEIVELVITPDSPVVGQTLMAIALPKGILVAYILKGSEMVVPKGGSTLNHGDSVGFILHKNAIPELELKFGSPLGR